MAAPGTPETSVRAQGAHAVRAAGTTRILTRDVSWAEREEVEPLDPEHRIRLGATPEPDAVAGDETPHDSRKGLRGLKHGAAQPGPRVQHQGEEQVSPWAGGRSLDQPAGDGACHEGDRRDGPRAAHMVARSLVGPVEEPSLHGFRPDLVQGRDGGRRLRRT